MLPEQPILNPGCPISGTVCQRFLVQPKESNVGLLLSLLARFDGRGAILKGVDDEGDF